MTTMTDHSLLLQTMASRERRRAYLRERTEDELASMEAGFRKWEPRLYPAGPLLLAEVEAEEQRRRVMAAAGE